VQIVNATGVVNAQLLVHHRLASIIKLFVVSNFVQHNFK
jgi:hypothetical protein